MQIINPSSSLALDPVKSGKCPEEQDRIGNRVKGSAISEDVAF